jgi:arsenite methyltransferase
MSSETGEQKATPSVEEDPTYFELHAYTGATKHMGGLSTTKELIELCSIDEDTYVLEVGCGVGATACYMAKKLGCRVLGVDIRPSMIERAKERASRERVEDRVEFRMADATDLPFEDATFDVVLVESVTTFIDDKASAIREYARVAKPGGCVGLNEEIWLKTPPPQEMVDYAARTWDIHIEIVTLDRWVDLLEASGLKVTLASPRTFEAMTNVSELARYGCRGFLTMLWRTTKLYFTSAAFRKYMRDRRQRLPKGIWDYLGYALLVGRKPARA